MSPAPVWSQLLHDHAHTGRSTWFGPSSYSAGWTKALVGPGAGVAVTPGGNLVFASRNRTVTCLDPTGEVLWTFTTDRPILSSPPVVDATGTVYVTDGNVYAIDPAGAQSWKYPAALPTTLATAPMSMGPDGTLYVLTTTVAGQPNWLLALTPGTTPVLRWELQLPGATTSAPACDAAGNLYLGGGDGILRGVDAATGSSRSIWTAPAGSTIPTPPSIGADGTVYAGVQHADTTKNALVAVTPGPSPQLAWQYVPSPSEYLNGSSAPAIGPDGTIYVGFECLHAVSPDGHKRWSSAPSATQTAPGIPAVGADGSVYVTTADGTLWCYSDEGAVVWQAPAAAPGGIPALSQSGALYVGTNGDSLFTTAAAPPLGSRLATLYYGLASTRTGTSQLTYTVDASSVTDAGIWALLPPALGATQAVVTGDADALTIAAGSVVLTGSSTFLGVAATVTLTFSAAAGDEVVLSFAAKLADGTTLAQVFPALGQTFYEAVSFTGATITRSATSGGTVPAGWSFSGTTDAGQASLATSARLLGLTGPQPAVGTVVLNGALPVVDLTVGAAQPVVLSGEYDLTCAPRRPSAATQST